MAPGADCLPQPYLTIVNVAHALVCRCAALVKADQL